MRNFTVNSKDSFVLIVDIQEKLLPAMSEAEMVRKNSYILVKAAEALGLPTIVTEQYPKGLGATISELKDKLKEIGALYSDKTAFNAITPKVKESLFDSSFSGRKNAIIFGIEAHICVFQSVRTLLNLGYNVFVPIDAVSSREIKNKENALSMFIQMGAMVSSTEALLFDLLEDSKNPHFKELNTLIK